jgi:hypothetical protein
MAGKHMAGVFSGVAEPCGTGPGFKAIRQQLGAPKVGCSYRPVHGYLSSPGTMLSSGCELRVQLLPFRLACPDLGTNDGTGLSFPAVTSFPSISRTQSAPLVTLFSIFFSTRSEPASAAGVRGSPDSANAMHGA